MNGENGERKILTSASGLKLFCCCCIEERPYFWVREIVCVVEAETESEAIEHCLNKYSGTKKADWTASEMSGFKVYEIFDHIRS